MRPSRFTEVEIGQALQAVRNGTPAVVVCRNLGITQTTFYRWRTKYEAPTLAELRELHALRDENEKLRRIVANLLLERQETALPRGRK